MNIKDSLHTESATIKIALNCKHNVMNGERGTRERPSFSLLCDITDVYRKATSVSRLISHNRNVTSMHNPYEQKKYGPASEAVF